MDINFLIIVVTTGTVAFIAIWFWQKNAAKRLANQLYSDVLAHMPAPGVNSGLSPESDHVVTVSESDVKCSRSDGITESMKWSELRKVEIVSTGEGPHVPDIFWVLYGPSEVLVIPWGATGKNELFDRLQALPGFRNDAIVNAASLTTSNQLLCWERGSDSSEKTQRRRGMHIVEHRFDELSSIKYRIFTCDISDERNATALILKFIGSYGCGSAGNGDGEFMRTITLCALSLWHAHAVIFDLQELDYEWGNTIWGMYGRNINPSGVDGLPYATVVSDRCRAGFESCEVIVAPIFDDLDTALENIRPRAQEYLAKLWEEIDGKK